MTAEAEAAGLGVHSGGGVLDSTDGGTLDSTTVRSRLLIHVHELHLQTNLLNKKVLY